MNIVFMGTPEFAVPSFEKVQQEFGVKAVFTQPDRPKGRGKAMAMSAVKEAALKYDIPVYQPEKLKNSPELIEMLKGMDLDFIIVVAFGQLLSKEVLDIPKYGCINLHASLLPKYRGAAPLNFAVMNGEKISGNTTMLMDVGLDTGDMLLKDEVKITEDMTSGELHDILMERGANTLIETINGLVAGTIKPVPQGDSDTCYASMLNREMANIDWNQEGEKVHNFIRGLNPFPVAYTRYDEKVMKIFESKVLNKKEAKDVLPGTIMKVSKNGMEVAVADGAVLISKIQFPGKRAMSVEEYLRGNTLEEGKVLHR